MITTYGDKTVTIVFDDKVQLDFPMESIAEQISQDDPNNLTESI